MSDHPPLLVGSDFAKEIADYVAAHRLFDRMSKREAVATAVDLLLSDIGAAQAFCQELGLDVDLYDRGAAS